MSDAWGQQHHDASWPSKTSWWCLAAFIVAVHSVGALLYVQANYFMTPVERYYLPSYLGSYWLGKGKSEYTLIYVVSAKGNRALVTEEWVEPGAVALAGSREVLPFTLKPEFMRKGVGLQWEKGRQDNGTMYAWFRELIYHQQSLTDLLLPTGYGSLAVLALGLFVAVPLDRRRTEVYRKGRQLKGPQLVSRRRFNRKLKSDGMGFALTRNKVARSLFGDPALRVPREQESSHFLIMGDSGTGKSALIRQMLAEIEARGETAIVYDPALEYTPQFYSPERGDVILNPLDERMPYWSPGDEVRHDAEALTLAASLFPDRPRENPFFQETPRQIFAHLLTFKPSPQELTYWMCHEEEIDRRVKGTEYAAMISPTAGSQRQGVLGSLNKVAHSFKLLPTSEQRMRWSAAEWSRERRGWIFVTSTPEYRESLQPLISMWLDTLVLRLMNHGQPGPRPVWFILDELASLNKLPQLHTAITENRKSNNPVVLGFQGRSQLETRYGHDAEAMLSQPATKIFLRTSEPKSAKWISETIGEVEMERLRESRGSGALSKKNYTWDRRVEPLVMPSQITGLAKLHGYMKSGNLVVRMQFPYVQFPKVQPAFIQREMPRFERQVAVALPPQQPSDYTQEQRPKARSAAQSEQQDVKPTSVANQQQEHFFE